MVVDARRWEIGVAEPFLDSGDNRVVVKRICANEVLKKLMNLTAFF
jgi:hypothetical protein